MPKISERGQNVPFSPFRKLIPYAEKAKAEGKHVFHLNIGQPDILTPPYAVEQFNQIDKRIIAYCPSVGNLSYRKKLATYYRKFNLDLDPDNIIVTNGASEALQYVFQACMNPEDEVLTPEPFYANYLGFAHSCAVKIRPIPCSIEDGFALPSIETFESMITPRTKAILITNPNNPTGAFYDLSKLKELTTLAIKYDLYLIADEVYREFCYDDQRFDSILNLAGADDHTIVIDSISKIFSACGARVGAILTRNEGVLESITRYAKLRLSPPALGQMLAECILGGEAEYIQEVKAEYDRRRQVVFNRLQRMPGVTSYLPGGAFYCFARFPIHDCNHFCQWLLENFDYQGNTVMLAMGDAFYATPGRGKDEVRIAFVLNTVDLNKAMDCLEVALKVYPYKKLPVSSLILEE